MINAIKSGKNWLNGLIANYFQRARIYSDYRFIFEIALISFVLKVLFPLFFWPILDNRTTSNTEELAQGGLGKLFLVLVILAPIIETLVGQWIPIQVASLFSKHQVFLVSVSAVFFASLHLSWDLVSFFTVLPGAAFLAWSFVIKRKESFWHAYWVTTAIHSLHNLIVLCVYLIAKRYSLI